MMVDKIGLPRGNRFGRVHKQAEAKITRDYQSNFIFKEPTVNVTVSKYTERSVFLSGALNKGPYIFPRSRSNEYY